MKKDDRYYLVTYYYNPTWDLYYPFYDDLNKTPIFKESKAAAYKDLLDEANEVINIDLDRKMDLAKKRFVELVGSKCDVKQSVLKETFELKYSKTANAYTIYKFYNFVITKVDNIDVLLNPKKLGCKLQSLDTINESKVVSNAIWFSEIAIDELKENAINLDNKQENKQDLSKILYMCGII